MDKAQAIHAFWSSFGLPAIDEQSLYDENTLKEMEITLPYISYELSTGNIESAISLNASLWYRSTSWKEITQKADEIAAYIGYGGKIIPVTGGCIWVKLGNQFSRRMEDEFDRGLRRIVLSIDVDFFTST